MKVRVEILFGVGGWSDKYVDLDSLPGVGQQMEFPLGEGGKTLKARVARVEGSMVCLSPPDELDHRQLDLDGWTAHFIWPV